MKISATTRCEPADVWRWRRQQQSNAKKQLTAQNRGQETAKSFAIEQTIKNKQLRTNCWRCGYPTSWFAVRRLNVSYDQIRSVRRRQAITISSCFCRHHNDNDNREQHFKFVHLMMWCARLYVECVCCFSHCVFAGVIVVVALEPFVFCCFCYYCLYYILSFLHWVHVHSFGVFGAHVLKSTNNERVSKSSSPNTVNKPRCSIELISQNAESKKERNY